MGAQYTERFATRIEQALHDTDRSPTAAEELRDYLEDFDGGNFELYSRRTSPYHISSGDLVAVTMLSMEIRRNSRSGITPAAAAAIESDGDRIAALLEAVPAARPLHTLSEVEYAGWIGTGPALSLWRLLRDEVGIPPVAVYKLLARKRPHLLPIQDGVSRAALGSPANWWETWWRSLVARPELVDRIEAIRDEAQAAHVSILRTADIVIWMRNR